MTILNGWSKVYRSERGAVLCFLGVTATLVSICVPIGITVIGISLARVLWSVAICPHSHWHNAQEKSNHRTCGLLKSARWGRGEKGSNTKPVSHNKEAGQVEAFALWPQAAYLSCDISRAGETEGSGSSPHPPWRTAQDLAIRQNKAASSLPCLRQASRGRQARRRTPYKIRDMRRSAGPSQFDI